MLNEKAIANIEGIYSNGTSIVFGIVKREMGLNNYKGFVLKSNKLLDLGHGLLEHKSTQDNTFDVTYNV